MDAYDIMAYNHNSPYWVASTQANNYNNHRQPILIPSHLTPTIIDSAYPPVRPRRQLPLDRHRRCYSVYSANHDDDMLLLQVSNPTTQKKTTRDRRTSAPHMETCTANALSLHDTTTTAHSIGTQHHRHVVRKPLPLVIPNNSGTTSSRPQQKQQPSPPVSGNRLVHSPQRLLLRSPLSDRQSHPSVTTSPSNNSNGERRRPPSPNISILPKQPTFWNPRPEGSIHDAVSIVISSSNSSSSSHSSNGAVQLRRNLSRRLKGLLQPQRSKAEGGRGSGGTAAAAAAVREKHKALRIWSVERALTPLHNNNSISDEDRPSGQDINPYWVLTNTLPVADQLWEDADFDFQQIDTYAANVKQRGPMLTPALLAQKFLARPYRRDLFKLRSIFIWIMQNIAQATIIATHLSSGNNVGGDDKDSLLVLAERTLMTRECSSPLEMASLFCVMARAIGHEEAHLVYGRFRGQKDTIDRVQQPNHAWVALQVEGEYRFVDCWLGSPYYPDNNDKVETHWFLCQPTSMILTHFPNDDESHQYLEPPISPTTFFALPYAAMPYFWHHVRVLDFDPSCLDLVDDALCHLTLGLDPDIGCYAHVETQATIITDKSTTVVTETRGLAQCILSPTNDERICKVKAALPPTQTIGWLKIHCGPRMNNNSSAGTQEKVGPSHYPLALCFRLTRRHQRRSREGHRDTLAVVSTTTTTAAAAAEPSFEFVQLHVSPFDLYVQEPQCFYLYPMQQYIFRIKSDHSHHKLAVRSPTGRMYKLMYYPHDHTYDGTVSINDVGPWSLVCLLHSGGFHVIASWECES